MVPEMTPTAVLFPGQGSLTADSADFARGAWPELVELASQLAGDDVFTRAAESTAYAQPAIYVTSVAGWRELRFEPETIVAMAGHSLGEFSALAAAGAVDVEDGLRLVVTRGRLMSEAATGHGGMVALLGGTPEEAGELADEFGLTLANDNAPGQVVLSGDRSLIEALAAVARSRGFKALQLDVAGAFHSPAIAPAEAPFLAELQRVGWQAPAVPVVSGRSGLPFEDFAAELAAALVSPVHWRAVMAQLWDMGAREFVDVGPGRVLDRLAARIVPGLEEHALAR